MTIAMSTTLHVEAPIGGEIVRFDLLNNDGTARTLNLTNQTKDDKIVTLPDLGTGSTKTLWSCVTSHMTSPLGYFIAIDTNTPGTYTDNLSRTAFTSGFAPVASIEISTADAVAGVLTTPPTPVNEAVAIVIELYREIPLVIPSCACRSTVSNATQNKAISKIQARSNMASGFGSIKIRCLPLG